MDDKIVVGSLVRRNARMYRVSDVFHWSITPSFAFVLGRQQNQAETLYFTDLEPVFHEFRPGDIVSIVAPFAGNAIYCSTASYARRCHYCASANHMFVAEMELHFGYEFVVTRIETDHGQSYCKLGKYWWNELMLIPFNLRTPQVSPADASDPDLDDVLASLYDCMDGKRDDREDLLRKYKSLTGQDRPGFMR